VNQLKINDGHSDAISVLLMAIATPAAGYNHVTVSLYSLILALLNPRFYDDQTQKHSSADGLPTR